MIRSVVEGKQPSHQLRSQSMRCVEKDVELLDNQDVGLEAATFKGA